MSNNSGGSSNSSLPAHPYVSPGSHLNDFLPSFWQRQIDAAEQDSSDYRHPILPLARIKKVMKSDPDVKMIAADAPILFCKACEIFISEITARAFIIADSNKRRTLSRSDIAAALSKSDQFDFLIDIVPRELGRGGASGSHSQATGSGSGGSKRVQQNPTGAATGGAGGNIQEGSSGAGAQDVQHTYTSPSIPLSQNIQSMPAHPPHPSQLSVPTVPTVPSNDHSTSSPPGMVPVGKSEIVEQIDTLLGS